MKDLDREMYESELAQLDHCLTRKREALATMKTPAIRMIVQDSINRLESERVDLINTQPLYKKPVNNGVGYGIIALCLIVVMIALCY